MSPLGEANFPQRIEQTMLLESIALTVSSFTLIRIFKNIEILQ